MHGSDFRPLSGGSCHLGKRGGEASSNSPRDDADLGHEVPELLRVERLSTVRECPRRVRVHLDDQAISACGHCGPGHRNHLGAQAGAMTRISDDGQVGQRLERPEQP